MINNYSRDGISYSDKYQDLLNRGKSAAKMEAYAVTPFADTYILECDQFINNVLILLQKAVLVCQKDKLKITPLISRLLALQKHYEEICILFTNNTDEANIQISLFLINFISISGEISALQFEKMDEYKNVIIVSDLKEPSESLEKNTDSKNELKHDFKKSELKKELRQDQQEQTGNDLEKSCSTYRLYLRKKQNNDAKPKQHRNEKITKLNYLLLTLDDEKTSIVEKLKDFGTFYQKNRELLKNPARWIGKSSGETFVLEIDRILGRLK